MLWYIALDADHAVYLPAMDRPDSRALVGRLKSKVQVHLEAKSVSRVHAEFRPGPEPDSLRLTDPESRYGTRVNGCDVRASGPDGALVRSGDRIEFGDSDPILGAACLLHRLGLRVCLSALVEAGRQAAAANLRRLGGRVVDDARRETPDLLVMPRLTVTAKLVLGLLHQAVPVLPSFLDALLAAIAAGRPPPNPDSHRPALSEAALMSGPLAASVDFGRRPERSRLFAGRDFCFLNAADCARFGDIVRAAGGRALSTDSEASALAAGMSGGPADLAADTAVVIQRGLNAAAATADSWTGRVYAALRSAGRRPVYELEICWAVLACRTDRVCNPRLPCDPALLLGGSSATAADSAASAMFTQQLQQTPTRKRPSAALDVDSPQQPHQQEDCRRQRPRLSEAAAPPRPPSGTGTGLLGLFTDDSCASESPQPPAPQFAAAASNLRVASSRPQAEELSPPPPRGRLCSPSPSPPRPPPAPATKDSGAAADADPSAGGVVVRNRRRKAEADAAPPPQPPAVKRQASVLQFFGKTPAAPSAAPTPTPASKPAPATNPPSNPAPKIASPLKKPAPTPIPAPIPAPQPAQPAPLSEANGNVPFGQQKMLTKTPLSTAVAELTLSDFALADEARFLRVAKQSLMATTARRKAPPPSQVAAAAPDQALWRGHLVPNFKRFVSNRCSPSGHSSSSASAVSVASPAAAARSSAITRLAARCIGVGGAGSRSSSAEEPQQQLRPAIAAASRSGRFDLTDGDDNDDDDAEMDDGELRFDAAKVSNAVGRSVATDEAAASQADRLFDDLFT